jgi:hypothetical protein
LRDADRVVGSKKEGTVRRENLRGVGRRIVAGDGRARVERPAAAKGESHENRRRGRRYECLFFFSFFSFYYPGRTRQTSSESVDGGGFSARESRDVSAHAEGEELRKSIDDDNDDDGIKCGE